MSPKVDSYRPRLVDPLLSDAIAAFAAVMVVGARATGKTTTAARLASQVDRLDVPDVAATYRADPDAALRRAGRPLLLDEWQEVPEVLAAVKRSVDRDRTPGTVHPHREHPGDDRVVDLGRHGMRRAHRDAPAD